jgi:uncharacterized membrane protein YqjE
MLNFILKLCVLEPQLLMAHFKSYSDLMVESIQQAIITWRMRLLMYAVALVFLLLGVMSSSFALLLWAALPVLNEQYAWVLLGFPIFLLLGSWFFYAVAKSYKIEPLFNDVQEQLSLDILAICQATQR